MTALLLLALLSPAPAMLEGQVVNSAGEAVAGAEVGVSFTLSGQNPQAQIGYGESPIKSDANGQFRLSRDQVYNGHVVAAAGGQAGVAALPKSGAVKIRLRPVRSVTVTLVDADRVAGDSPSLLLVRGGQVIGFAGASFGANRLRLPSDPGLSLMASNDRTQMAEAPIQGGQMTLRLQGSAWAKAIGRVAPQINVTDSSVPNALAQAKGKWIVLYFWATWCGPCIAKFPEWMALYHRHAALRHQFEVLAMHSPDGESLAGVKTELDRIVAGPWKGQRPAFPLIFDRTGATHKRYGIEMYPTTLLIDPQGKLVGLTSPEDMERRLKAMATQSLFSLR
jgi:thiol-disulfide isomerase/thioredoxin